MLRFSKKGIAKKVTFKSFERAVTSDWVAVGT